MTGGVLSLAGGLTAQRSVLGWALSGPVPITPLNKSVQTSFQLFCLGVSETSLSNLWGLESVGIYDKELNGVNPVLEEFEQKVRYVDRRYTVSLPWKSETVRPTLRNNLNGAKKRLENLSRRLSRDPDLGTSYHGAIHEMWVDGVVEEVPVDQLSGAHLVYYMPHRPVLREASLTTKVRPVFDASAKGANGTSLNDCLNTGPSLISDLPGILLRFRRWKVALSADIRKAFLQIEVNREHQDVHWFLWDDGGVIRVMRFVWLPFGNKGSPFLLNATLKRHLAKFPESRVLQELWQNMYVDDWLSGCDDATEACSMLREAQNIMSQASMQLAKWGSNSLEVGELLLRELPDNCVGEDTLKVLGMKWIPQQDCFSFDGVTLPENLCLTKRMVLSVVARMFDPLGFITPVVMVMKCLFQRLWRLGLDWDELIPKDEHDLVTRWVEGLRQLHTWNIQRSYTGVPWRESVLFQLHGFGDASPQGYGACVCISVKLGSGVWKSSLVMSRAKVAPLKRLSLPRLELMGALLCARLLVYVQQALCLPENVRYHCWTDSRITLAWIQSDPHRWKPFVGNRVAEIQQITSPAQWRHCVSENNPADLVTRGISAKELMQSNQWLHGPDFLCSEFQSATLRGEADKRQKAVCGLSEEGPNLPVDICFQELEKPGTSVLMSSSVENCFDVGRWSTLKKALRLVAWVLGS